MTLPPLLDHLHQALIAAGDRPRPAAYTVATAAARIATRVAQPGAHAERWDFCALALDDAADALRPASTSDTLVVGPEAITATSASDLQKNDFRALIVALHDLCVAASGSAEQSADEREAWAAAAGHTRRAVEELP